MELNRTLHSFFLLGFLVDLWYCRGSKRFYPHQAFFLVAPINQHPSRAFHTSNRFFDSFKQKSHSLMSGATACHTPWSLGAAGLPPSARPVLGIHVVLEGKELQLNILMAPRILQTGKTWQSMVAWTLGLLILRNLLLPSVCCSL